MNRRQSQAESEEARQRAVGLGETGDASAITELVALCRHSGPTVRRAAASALGKLAASDGIRQAVPALCALARDVHPQVRQYALLALGKIGEDVALPVLRDAANRSSDPEYVLRAALHAIEQVEAARRARASVDPVACSRCGRPTRPEDRDLSLRQFQRAYCHACFDAVFIERRNFDMKVQNQKTILTADRTVVQSQGERVIADWLHAHAIECRYDDKFQIIQGFAVRPDFYLPRYDLYIEYWGLDTTDYRIGMLLKQKLYQQEGKRLVSLYPRDLPSLDAKLSAALLPAPERRQPGPPPPIRPARPEDLEAINAIYNHYVAASACTYQEEPETMEGRRAWFGRHGAAHPVIVAETDGCVVGWGSLSPYHARSAYRHTVEDSVYVADTCRGRGVGKALLHELVLRARALGHRAIIAQIDGGQAASIALHARFGFEQVGRLSQVGFKFGRWLDVVIMELLLVKEGVQDDHTG